MNEILEAIYNRLTSLLSVDVYDQTPQDRNSFPYVQLNVPSTDENDTDLENGFNASVDIVSYSRYRGSKEINDLVKEIYDALHRWDFPDTASYCISIIQQVASGVTRSPDGITRDSIQTFKIIFENKPTA